ncbi:MULTISPECIES: hypothetical protein [Fluviicola]|uniref:hypothetical protein n=1 Tax=Fluviicola TaxID=332102 RepID=UPI003137DA43
MKNKTVLALAITTLMFSCNQPSTKEAEDANQKLETAKKAQDEAYKEKITADWNGFKKESDSLIAGMESDLKKMEVTLAKENKKNTQKLKAEYLKTKNELASLKDKLHQRNEAFKKDLKKIDHLVEEKNESFKREFKHDTDELMKSLEDLFKDNVK